MLRRAFIIVFFGVLSVNAQTLVGTMGAAGIMGSLQAMNSTAALTGLNAANGANSVNAQQNAAINQALNGTPPPASTTPIVPTVRPAVMPVAQPGSVGTGGTGGAGGAGGAGGTGGTGGAMPVPTPVTIQPVTPSPRPVTRPAPGSHHPMLAGTIRVLTVPVQADVATGSATLRRGGILRMVGGFGGFRLTPRFGRSATNPRVAASSGVTSSSGNVGSASTRSTISASSLRASRTVQRRNVRMGFTLR